MGKKVNMSYFECSKIDNVILITIDALRADHLGYIGYDKKTTPNLDKMAEKSLVFKRAYANGPFTRPSFISILSSTYPMMYDGYFKLSKFRPSIQDSLSRSNIKTAAIHSNTYLSRYYGYNRGFDYFYDSFGKRTSRRKGIIKKVFNFFTKRINKENIIHKIGKKFYWNIKKKEKPYEVAQKITNKNIKYIKENKNKNFFLWTHYMDPHAPYDPPRYMGNELTEEGKKHLEGIKNKKYYLKNYNESDKEVMKKLYDSEIRYTDFWIGRLLNKLKNLGLMKNTAIIITADHGEEFFDHGDPAHYSKLYNELLHVPLLIYHPDIKSKKVKTPVELLDISPTILDMFNIKSPKNFLGESLLQEKDLKPIISEVSNPTNTWEIDLDVRKTSCILGNWKYIMGQTEKGELYNLEKDPKEENNLVGNHPELEKELINIIKKHRNKYKPIKGNISTNDKKIYI